MLEEKIYLSEIKTEFKFRGHLSEQYFGKIIFGAKFETARRARSLILTV